MKTRGLLIIAALFLVACDSLGLVATITPQGTNPAAVLPTPDIPEDWLTYNNEFLSYSFRYPREADVVETGVTGYPSDELPAGMTVGDYFTHLESIYPPNLCVRVKLPGAFLSITPPDEHGGKYTGPCGITGIGNTYTSEQFEEVIYLAGDNRTVQWTKLFDNSSGEWQHEFVGMRLNGFLFDFGSFDFGGERTTSETEFLQARPDLLLILASFEWVEP